MNPLKGKRVALLGGMGSREEVRQRIIDELELQELDWVISEKNKSKEYETFADGVYPGKYDYVYILTKFISHKALDIVTKAVKPTGIPTIRINGSYNMQNFLNALFEQTAFKSIEEPQEETPAQVVTKKLLEPARPDERQAITPIEEPTKQTSDAKEWQDAFGAATPQEAKLRVATTVRSLEIRVEKLSANQQDQDLIEAAQEYHSAVEEMFGGMPVPHHIVQARTALTKAFAKHNIAIPVVKKRKYEEDNVTLSIMKTNVLFADVLSNVRQVFDLYRQFMPYDRYGACIHCKSHKSKGCAPNCARALLDKEIKYIDSAKNLANEPGVKELFESLKLQ